MWRQNKKNDQPNYTRIGKNSLRHIVLWLADNVCPLSNMIAINNGVNYDEMWSFADEIHKFLGNRPKMYPGVIGGHCVIPNLDLINDETLNFIKILNTKYMKKLNKKK